MYDNTGGYPILNHQIIILPARLQLNAVSSFHGQVTTLKHHKSLLLAKSNLFETEISIFNA
jgi:hypothetical protein